MTFSPKIVLSTIVPGLLAIALFWWVLSSRAAEHERIRSERPRTEDVRPAPRTPPRTVQPVPTSAESPEGRPAAEPPVPRPSPAPAPRVAPDAPSLPAAPAVPDEKLPFLRRPEAGEVPELQARAQDLSADPKQRLEALARLRVAQPDGRSPEVIRSMIDLLRTSPDGAIRADICRQLNRVVNDDLKQQLLVTGRTDVDATAREEAVESLGAMKGDPLVRQFLETCVVTDPSEKVRNQAKRSLAGRR
jgi:hypothetical protein